MTLDVGAMIEGTGLAGVGVDGNSPGTDDVASGGGGGHGGIGGEAESGADGGGSYDDIILPSMVGSRGGHVIGESPATGGQGGAVVNILNKRIEELRQELKGQ